MQHNGVMQFIAKTTMYEFRCLKPEVCLNSSPVLDPATSVKQKFALSPCPVSSLCWLVSRSSLRELHLTRSPRRLSSSLLRKLEGIIGDVVVTFELQLLDPSPFVYADPGKTLPSVSPLRPHSFLMTVHVACWCTRGRWVLPVDLDEAHCCCCLLADNIRGGVFVTVDRHPQSTCRPVLADPDINVPRLGLFLWRLCLLQGGPRGGPMVLSPLVFCCRSNLSAEANFD